MPGRNPNLSGRWIWENLSPEKDEYADFYMTFTKPKEESINLSFRISCDSNYAAYLNGKLISFGQYADYPHYKVADDICIDSFCREGENELLITVWYYGLDTTSVYAPGKAGVIFDVVCRRDIYEWTLISSGSLTKSRRNPNYRSHYEKQITGQLGYSYRYDASAQVPSDGGWHDSYELDISPTLHLRPIKNLYLDELVPGRIIGGDGKRHFLLDLGREEVGFLSLDLVSEAVQTVTVAFGEHICDGGVRRYLGGREFTVEYDAKIGENSFQNHFRRLGCRYLEIFTEGDIELRCAGIIPTLYPVRETKPIFSSPLRQRIYDVSVRTLRLCMHEHYEDCPWREQALYAMDSRNQMLAGYYAFTEFEFPRANLHLAAQDNRPDGLLSITYPCGVDLAIPSFSLHYITEVYEYTRYSGDLSLAKEIWPKLESVIGVFLSRIRNGLVPTFTESGLWNFYEWAPGLDNDLWSVHPEHLKSGQPDLILNCLLIRALDMLNDLARMICRKNEWTDIADTIREAVVRDFYLPDENVFITRVIDCGSYVNEKHVSELGNALAILSGAVTGEKARALAAKLASSDNGMVPVTLSMTCFKYDALLKVSADARDIGDTSVCYRDYILSDIDSAYGYMLDSGATSFWETIKGASDFGSAGSLCHGWSAMPAYYYLILDA